MLLFVLDHFSVVSDELLLKVLDLSDCASLEFGCVEERLS